jgi:hypothetical protein
MAKTVAPEGAPAETPVSNPPTEQKYTIVEHCVYVVPPATKIAYWDGDKLITKDIPNPCPLVPGGQYTKAAIEALTANA